MKEKLKNNKPSICFVAHFAYGAMAGGDSGHIGGVERQTSLMARWFVARGYDVSMITWDEGFADGIEIDGVRIYKMCKWKAGLPGLRFVMPRWSSLIAAMKRADADVYYQNCAEYVTGQVALWCRKNGRKFIYSVASDPDCDGSLPKMKTIRERFLYRYGIKHADSIVVQSKKQQQMLKSGFAQDSIVLPMPCPGPEGELELRLNKRNRVLWIGRLCKVKRPDRLLKLAIACPEVIFDFVGPQDGSDYSRQVSDEAGKIENIMVHGPACRDRVSAFYKNADILCCTSDIEGFPNTFLEAWSYGLPIVSTFDPDNLIADKGLGRVGKDIPELASALKLLLINSEQWQLASETSRKYYLENHCVDVAMANFEKLFTETNLRN